MSETSRKRRRAADIATILEESSIEDLARLQMKISHERTKRALALVPEFAGTPIEFAVRNETYSASEVLTLMNDSYYRGMKARGEIDGAAMRLGWLLQEVLRIVAYAEPYKQREMLLDLAEKSAQGKSFDALGGEILKRFSMLTSIWERNVWNKFSEYNSIIAEDMKAIRAAVLDFDKDGGDSLRQNLNRLGTIAVWAYPEDWKKNTGMSDDREALIHRAESIQQRNPKLTMGKVAKTILAQIEANGGPIDSQEKFAWDTLKRYEQKAKDAGEAETLMGKYLTKLRNKLKKGRS